jgi:hypothetical protein
MNGLDLLTICDGFSLTCSVSVLEEDGAVVEESESSLATEFGEASGFTFELRQEGSDQTKQIRENFVCT